ncbi:redoxin family protein [Hephaestia mangrovi]|uniref:redoxin family protein n=1 Tax=Hephaestia mangrovi TaxID=2873268 RepID=UPI001CA7597E|nr:redoxin family protein [Hephaestia mangrovi]MBY8827546.1 redoxin family protein [Hephaestia mangrovi]
MKRVLLWVPLGAFALLFAVVASGLFRPSDHLVHSQMVGKALPQFTLPKMVPDAPGLASTTFTDGKPRLLNVFASWCIPCMAESPNLMALKQHGVEIDAVAVRDTPRNVEDFLKRFGNPYARIGDDRQSAVQLALGSSGVPETYVIDGHGRIVEQHIGDVRAEDVPALLAALKKAGG